VDLERRVGTRSGAIDAVLHAEVNLPSAGAQPKPTATGEGVRLRDLGEAENPNVEGSRRRLGAYRDRDLNVV